MEKIPADNIKIEKLNPAHKEKIKSFKSYEKELIDFLIEDALDNQNKKISVKIAYRNFFNDQIK